MRRLHSLLLVATGALCATAVACSSQAAATPTPRPDVVASSGTPQSFRSVRSYQDVALPVRLRIPAAQVDAPLVRVGRAADQTIQVPADFATPGWFEEGPRPGQPGPAVILGHVDSKRGPAVFYRMRTLRQGADVYVDRADGSTATFRVTSVERVPKDKFPTDLVYAPTLEPSLRLITCGGSFDPAARSYLDNVIAYAAPTG